MNCMIPFVSKIQNMQINRNRQISGCWSWGRENSVVTANRQRVSVQGDENALDSGTGCTTL